MPKVVNFGPFTIHLYGLVIAIAIYIGWLLAKKRAYLYKIPEKIFDDPVLIIPLFFGIVGARLYHVIDYWSTYSQDLISILFINRGGLGIWGGLAGSLIGFLIVARIKKLDVFSLLDLTAPSLLLGQAIGRFANYINQEGFGPPTNLRWAVYIEPLNRPLQFSNSTHFHPTFFYEAFIDLVFFFLILFFAKRLKIKGQIFALYLIFYSLGRFIVEFWRIDTATIGQLKVAHLISIGAFILGFWLFFRKTRKSVRA